MNYLFYSKLSYSNSTSLLSVPGSTNSRVGESIGSTLYYLGIVSLKKASVPGEAMTLIFYIGAVALIGVLESGNILSDLSLGILRSIK